MMGNNLPTLLWAGQMGALELHTVHTRIDPWPDGYDLSTKFTGSVENIEGSLLNYPDYAVIDLDPYIYSGKEAHGTDPELNKIGFSKTCEIAIALHEILEQLGIKTFVKTSGRTGLHIYVPLIRNINEDAARAFAATIGNHILAKYPNDVTVEWAKVKRTGKIFFDYNMNARGKTLPSAYTLRTAEVPSVSCPLKWEEVGKIYPTELTLENVPSRVDEIGDLWANILGNKTDLRQLVIERRP
jgi:bifunctional non-homologous end joining protein LigD